MLGAYLWRNRGCYRSGLDTPYLSVHQAVSLLAAGSAYVPFLCGFPPLLLTVASGIDLFGGILLDPPPPLLEGAYEKNQAAGLPSAG